MYGTILMFQSLKRFITRVTEVTDTQVYVVYKGNEYSFYAYKAELEVGDEIVCQFTDNWEIVGVTE
jgi:hypothetical protein